VIDGSGVEHPLGGLCRAPRPDAGLGRDERDRTGHSGESILAALQSERFHQGLELRWHRGEEPDAPGTIS